MSFIAAGIIVGGGSLLSAGIGAAASGSAAGKQANAAQHSADVQQQMFNTIQNNEQPFVQAGTNSQKQLDYLLGIGPKNSEITAGSSASGDYGSLNKPFTIDDFHNLSPAYQFQMQQGQNGVLNQASSAQGAESGAAMKDLVSFNQNYANTAFNNAFNQYQTQQGNTFNRLFGIANQGQAAGSNSTTGASTFAGNIGSAYQNVGNAQASGIVGAANAISGGINAATPWLYAGSGGSPATSTVQPVGNSGNFDGSLSVGQF